MWRVVSASLAEILVSDLDVDHDKPLHADLSERELFRSPTEILAEAYRLQGEKIAYQEDALALREEPPKYGD